MNSDKKLLISAKKSSHTVKNSLNSGGIGMNPGKKLSISGGMMLNTGKKSLYSAHKDGILGQN